MAQQKYLQIMPATDWFFVHGGKQEPITVWHLAAWALTEEGDVVGLVGAGGPEQAREGQAPKLVVIPTLEGHYRHRDQLTPAERVALERR